MHRQYTNGVLCNISVCIFIKLIRFTCMLIIVRWKTMRFQWFFIRLNVQGLTISFLMSYSKWFGIRFSGTTMKIFSFEEISEKLFLENFIQSPVESILTVLSAQATKPKWQVERLHVWMHFKRKQKISLLIRDKDTLRNESSQKHPNARNIYHYKKMYLYTIHPFTCILILIINFFYPNGLQEEYAVMNIERKKKLRRS